MCDKIVRLRPKLSLRGTPPPYGGKGRRPVHGAKFKLTDATTWGTPAETLTLTEDQLGPIQLSLGCAKHCVKSSEHPFPVVQIKRLEVKGTRRDPKDLLWLSWFGQAPPPLSNWWRSYLRRYGITHGYRFGKQALPWTVPHLKTLVD